MLFSNGDANEIAVVTYESTGSLVQEMTSEKELLKQRITVKAPMKPSL